MAFDITFRDADGNKVQPGYGKTVSVSFFVSADSLMNQGNNEKSTFKVFHFEDNGISELMRSVPAYGVGSSANISFEANSFSVYMLMKETVESSTVPLLRAGTPKVVDVAITNFELQNLSHETPQTLFYSDTFYLAMSWDASSLGATLHEGDYFDITLPDNMRFPSGTTARDFNLLDDNENVIATAHVTPGEANVGGNLRVTFTDTVENKYDVKGTIYLAARFNQTQITTSENNTFSITVNGDVSGTPQTIETGVVIKGPKELDNECLNKWGQSVYNEPTQAEWWVRINHTKATLSNVVITDTLGSTGETYLEDSFILRLVEYDQYGKTLSSTNVDISDKLTISDD